MIKNKLSFKKHNISVIKLVYFWRKKCLFCIFFENRKPNPGTRVFLKIKTRNPVFQNPAGSPITNPDKYFCFSSIEQVIQHGEVDVFQAVKTVRRHRPQLVENIVSFFFNF